MLYRYRHIDVDTQIQIQIHNRDTVRGIDMNADAKRAEQIEKINMKYDTRNSALTERLFSSNYEE